MTENDEVSRWVDLFNARGIAGCGARETEEDKLIVECDKIREFANTIERLAGKSITKIEHQKPPLPDFCAVAEQQTLGIELTEFIDPKALKESKYIRKTPEHPLHKEAITFHTDYLWFSELLETRIRSKDQRYANRQNKIDVLLIWNEALDVGIEDTDNWLKRFETPAISSITSIYFQSWYHPSYYARPTWSIVPHPTIGPLTPKRKPVE